MRFMNVGKYSNADTLLLVDYYIKDKKGFRESFIKILQQECFSNISLVSVCDKEVIDILQLSFQTNHKQNLFLIRANDTSDIKIDKRSIHFNIR